jgi:hypothetical protein
MLVWSGVRTPTWTSAVGRGTLASINMRREVAPTPYSLAYLQTKKEKMGHALSLRENEGAELSHFGAPGSTVPIIKSAGMLHLVSELKEQLFPV